MLTEQIVASIGPAFKLPNASTTKDAAIIHFELQPMPARRTELKKSATMQNCLAISPSHIYAAQCDKAMVNIYSRERNALEAAIPFKERISCLALACRDTILVMGTEQGRLYLWETHTGRQISTPQAHLQPITALAIDPTSNLILSGSLDAAIHVWSLPSLLSFSAPPTSSSQQHFRTSPIRTFSAHRNAITALTTGHSASFCNYAVSASRDNTIMLWDYNTETILRTVLLDSAPLCLCLDPADRAIYTAFEDGSIQTIDLLSTHSVADVRSESTGSTVQPDVSTRWTPPVNDAVGATHSLAVSYDGTRLISGHASGKMLTWDIPTGTYASNLTIPALAGPVMNLVPLPVTGFRDQQLFPSRTINDNDDDNDNDNNDRRRHFVQPTITKPRFGDYDLNTDGRVPESYTVNVQYTTDLARDEEWEEMLSHTVFPDSVLQEGILALSSFGAGSSQAAASGSGSGSGPGSVLPDSTVSGTGRSQNATDRSMSSAGVENDDAKLDTADAEEQGEGYISLSAPRNPDRFTTVNPKVTTSGHRHAAASGGRCSTTTDLEMENESLKRQLVALRKVTRASMAQFDRLVAAESRMRNGDSSGGGSSGRGTDTGTAGPSARRGDMDASELRSAEREWDSLA